MVVFAVAIAQRRGSVREQLYSKPAIVGRAVFYLLFVAIIVFGAYGIGYESSQFIYNQF